MRRWRRLLVLVLLAPASLAAQGTTRPRPPGGQPPPPPPVRPDTLRRAPGDTTTRDTAKKALVQWEETDSVMQALEARPGYSVTKYQGAAVIFDASSRALSVQGDPAAVARGDVLIVSDTLFYDDSLKIVRARGDTIVLRDPGRGSADVVSRGSLVYDIARRKANVTNVSTAVESGERWFVMARKGGFVSDTAGEGSTALYARDGSITSCDDPVPHYHFQSKEIKVVAKNILVARPAVLYIADVPVMWLPFIFQDLRSGRRSGVLPPRFGVSELVRNSPSYRRHVEDFGYYFAISEFMDAQVAVDWRSGAHATPGDPGWIRYKGEWRYRWLDRFLTGRIASEYLRRRDGSNTMNLSLDHQQDFSQSSHLTANLNYVTSTTIQRQTTFNPYAVLATIASRANYQQSLGFASFSVGGSRRQYPGRSQIDQDFPNFNIAPKGPIALLPWLVWTPTLNASNSQSLKIDQGGRSNFRFLRSPGGALDSVRTDAQTRSTSASFNTPLKIFNFNWNNSFSLSDRENDFPESRTVYGDINDSTTKSTRVFARTFLTALDWQTSFSLPSLLQGRLNLTPSVSLQNVDGSAFWVRSENTGGAYVHQSKRLNYALSASPTFFGLFRGFGPVARFRHSINPGISYSYAPRARVSDEFLAAIGRRRQGDLGSLQQNSVSLSMSQNIEAKLKTKGDSADSEGRKVKVLSLSFDPLTYNFERYKEVKKNAKDPSGVSRWAGLATDRFGYGLRSELLPGFDFRSSYSLFEGNPLSDTARFAPYREDIRTTFSLGRNSGVFNLFSRIFGRAVAQTAPELERTQPSADDFMARQVAAQPVAGSISRNSQFAVPSTRGWQAQLSYTSHRQRPPVGGNVIFIDPKAECAGLAANPFQFDQCVLTKSTAPADEDATNQTTEGAPFRRTPSTESAQSSLSFSITPKWTAQWQTTYDFKEAAFASQIVSLQRELHDWRAIFAFTQAPNGNFAFNFFIALKAQPDLKFDYNKQTYRSSTR